MVWSKRPSGARRVAIATIALAAVTLPCRAQTRFAEFPSDSDRALLMRVIAAEDARAGTMQELVEIRAALGSRSPALRRFAVRSVGRLERGSLAYLIIPLLSDSNASVRSAAAVALTQAASHDDARAAWENFSARVNVETNDSTLGQIAESIGRLRSHDTSRLATTAQRLTSISLRRRGRTIEDAPPIVLRGVVRGLYFLSRQPRAGREFPGEAVQRLQHLTAYGRSAFDTSSTAAYIRTLAAMTLVGVRGATLVDLDALEADPVAAVREQAVIAAASFSDTGIVRTIVARALRDSAPLVRFRAIALYDRRLRATDGCIPLLAAAHDSNTSVAINAIDALGSCRPDFPAARLLDSIAGTLSDHPAEWHRAAHALVSLAGAAPVAARRRLPLFLADTNFFVRTYVARAAARIRDTATLVRLADPAEHPNVRTAAIDGLVQVGGSRDSIYMAALASDASQLLQSASKALSGSANPAAQLALLGALDRVTALHRETMRDARIAMIDALKTEGQHPSSGRLQPFLADYDSVVAAKAADVIGAWTGQRPKIAPRPLPPVPSPKLLDLERLESANGEIQMESGDRIVVRFFPLDAPTNVWRFASQARAGFFDGLTFHRVVPWFVVQGGSPGANEYMGDARFTRDELGLENGRGTIGLSTRGRDSGDGQLYFNLVDNVRLDHDYTVWGEVVSGMGAVDRMQEAARIRSVAIR